MDRDWIDNLLGKIELTALISRYVPLTRKGKTYWGCCPFHHEKTPSFSVDSDKQFYHCFGCKESGDAIKFVQKIENVDFIDAVKILADEVKLPLPELTQNPDAKASREKRDRLYALLRDAAKHYHDNLKADKDGKAAAYLKARNIDERLMMRFGLGLSQNGNEMLTYLEKLGYTKTEMKEAGIAEQKAADWYDVFYGRLMFPIIDNFSQVTGFGGRLINMESHIAVKYRNTSATAIFDKSKTLYAVNLLKKRKQRAPIPYVIIVEGYMDVIALHRAGFDTAVAGLGTALTVNQAKILRNYSPNVYISYDGDSAGQTATLRGLDILAGAGLNVKVVSLPDGLDPDDLISQRGKDAYQNLLDNALTLPAFKIKNLAEKYDLKQPDQKAKFGIEAVAVVKALENPVEREEYLKDIQRLTGYADETLRRQAEIADAGDPEPPPESVEEPVQIIPKAELFVLSSLLHGMPYAKPADDVYPYLTDDTARQAYEYYIDRINAGKPISVASLFSAVDAPGIEGIVGYEFLSGDNENKYRAVLTGLKEQHLKREKIRLAAVYDQQPDAAILKEIMRIDSELLRIKNGGV